MAGEPHDFKITGNVMIGAHVDYDAALRHVMELCRGFEVELRKFSSGASIVVRGADRAVPTAGLDLDDDKDPYDPN
jgi:hypothetical protein